MERTGLAKFTIGLSVKGQVDNGAVGQALEGLRRRGVPGQGKGRIPGKRRGVLDKHLTL